MSTQLKNKQTDKKAAQIEEFEIILEEFPDISKNNICELIRHSKGKYIVFLDCEKELDWETTDDFDYKNKADEATRNEIYCRIESLQRQPSIRLFSAENRYDFFIILGNAWVCALDGMFDTANALFEKAEKYVKDRKIEISRKWQLQYSLLITLSLIIASLVIWLLKSQIAMVMNLNSTWVEAFSFTLLGTVGATLSIICKTGKTNYNCESGKLLNFLEIVSRMVAGIISAAILVVLFKLDLVFSSLKESHAAETLLFLCIIAGFSERLVPSILQKISTNEVEETDK